MPGWHELPHAILSLIYIIMSVVMLVGLFELVASYDTPMRAVWGSAHRRRPPDSAADQR